MSDYIRRQAAINIVCDDACDDCPDGGCDMYRRLKRLPAADVRPVVRGKWECATPVTCKCSKCGHAIGDWYVARYNYCPNCGADMREEEVTI